VLHVKDDAQVDLKGAIEYMAFNESLAEVCGQAVPIMTYSKGLISINKEARKFIHAYKDTSAYLANAIVVERLASRAMMQFIMKLIPSSKFPELVFESFSSAQFWLESEIKKSSWRFPELSFEELKANLENRIDDFKSSIPST
jgi:hypothetical protein